MLYYNNYSYNSTSPSSRPPLRGGPCEEPGPQPAAVPVWCAIQKHKSCRIVISHICDGSILSFYAVIVKLLLPVSLAGTLRNH